MPTPPENPENDPRSSKLPPANHDPESGESPSGWLPTAGVSRNIKVFVIGLTFVTVMAFGVFAAILIKKVFIKAPNTSDWEMQWVTLADELRERGLPRQAIEHYKKYLDTPKVDHKMRSRIALNIAQLNVELGQCDDAVVWFLHAKTAQPAAPEVQDSETLIQQCRSRSKISP